MTYHKEIRYKIRPRQDLSIATLAKLLCVADDYIPAGCGSEMPYQISYQFNKTTEKAEMVFFCPCTKQKGEVMDLIKLFANEVGRRESDFTIQEYEVYVDE